MAEKWNFGDLPPADKCYDPEETSMREILEGVRKEGNVFVELRNTGPNQLSFFCAICYESCGRGGMLRDHLNGREHVKRLDNAKKSLLKPTPWPFNDGFRYFFNEDGAKDPVDASGEEIDLVDIWDWEGEKSGFTARKIGDGLMGLVLSEEDEIRKIFCEWVGKKRGDKYIPECEISVVTFKWDYNLGRRRIDQPRFFVPFTTYCEGPGEVSSPDELLLTKELSGEEKERLTLQHMVAFDEKCDLCMQTFHPNKDVAVLLDPSSRRTVCDPTGLTSAFHPFHVSCLLQWILLCEADIQAGELAREAEKPVVRGSFENICCPTCLRCVKKEAADWDPDLPYRITFDYKIKLWKAVEKWFKDPEPLDNASVGLTLCDATSEESVVPLMRAISIYRAVPKN